MSHDPASPDETLPADLLQAGDDASIHPALGRALKARGYETLTPVQQAVLAHGADNRDLLVSAQTGSGKTVAFGMAMAPSILGEDMIFGPPLRPLALVIAPTRELALQVQRELDWLYAEAQVTTASCVGGMDPRTERRALQRGAHIVVGTPGRLRDHIERQALDLSGLRALVLDEADEMLDLGFREDLEFVLAAAPEDRRTLLFSATVPRAIAELAKTFQRNALRVQATAASERHADIAYELMLVPGEEREAAIINTLLSRPDSNAIVFCHTREAVKGLAQRLGERGFAVVVLSGELTQAERNSALSAMRDGRARICVATDVAARGLDLPNLDLVIHGEVPGNPDTLLHRSGRTGRAGRKGTCVLVVPLHRRAAAQRVLKLANVEAKLRKPPTAGEIEALYRSRLIETAAAEPLPAPEEAELVAELLTRMSPEQAVAAYLRLSMKDRPQPEQLAHFDLPPERMPRERRKETGERRMERQGEPRAMRGDLQDGVWFTITLGRKHRADPKWLLPLICKAGGLTKREVGSIKIEETETRFEIAADSAGDFAERIARNGSGEKGVTIAALEGSAPPPPRPRERAAAPRGARPAPHRKGAKPAGNPAQPAEQSLEEALAAASRPRGRKPAPRGAKGGKTDGHASRKHPKAGRKPG